MLKSVEGIFRNGRVELEEIPLQAEGSRVVVTFLSAHEDGITLAERGIDELQAADLRNRLKTIAQDWDRPEMDVYDAD
ncbi:MAG TPA: hypothetical protein VIM11_27050 [Tepidisphaeraceae bacterium]|jgi:hypothetical protein